MKAHQPFVALLTAVLLSACVSTSADASGGASQPATPGAREGAVASERVAGVGSPYRVEVIEGQDTAAYPAYASSGRFYVMGVLGERYRLRVTNPTNRRVEAVVSVDGLDVIDGEPADFVRKRGYIIAPNDELIVDGFRTSFEQVATFRFASVGEAYAARKGNDRNVGVIAVAFFTERAPLRRTPAPPAIGSPRRAMPQAPSGAAHEEAATASRSDVSAPAAPAARHKADDASASAGSSRAAGRAERRPGLGTEFGERVASHVEYTRFERATAAEPTRIVELRYNDRQGLLARGIDVDQSRAADDLALRETADPFPARAFATPPPAR